VQIKFEQIHLSRVLIQNSAQSAHQLASGLRYPEAAVGTRQATTQIAGVGFFLGFFASLVLRCCPLAMTILLGLVRLHNNTNRLCSLAFMKVFNMQTSFD
jgi:hypothetical protein